MKEVFVHAILNWGYIPAITMLAAYEEDGDYERCSALRDALEELKLPTSPALDVVAERTAEIIKGLRKPKLYKRNYPFYLSEFMTYVKERT